jgi:hypothetical protein
MLRIYDSVIIIDSLKSRYQTLFKLKATFAQPNHFFEIFSVPPEGFPQQFSKIIARLGTVLLDFPSVLLSCESIAQSEINSI